MLLFSTVYLIKEMFDLLNLSVFITTWKACYYVPYTVQHFQMASNSSFPLVNNQNFWC